ncbi:MAG: hypothetical protein ACYSTL_01325, partial [Planctomycetota bacterium]
MAGFTWRDVEGTEDFKSLSYEKKEELRDEFFMDEIAPKLEQKDLGDAYTMFVTQAPLERDDNLRRIGNRAWAMVQMSVGGVMQAAGAEMAGEGKPPLTPLQNIALQLAKARQTDQSWAEKAKSTLKATTTLLGAPHTALEPPISAVEVGGKAAYQTEVGKKAVEFLRKAGDGIAESGAINLEESQDYGIRRPDSIMREPLQAAKFYGATVGESFLGNMLPSLMVGHINRKAGLATMGGIVFGQEYAQERMDGKSHDMALKIAGVRAAAEVAFEVPAFNAAFGGGIKFLGKNWKRGGKFAKSKTGRLVGASILEGISEDFTEISNILFDRYGLGEEWPPEVQAQLKDAFVSGVMMGAPMTGTALTLEWMDSAKKQKLVDDFNKLIDQYGYIKPHVPLSLGGPEPVNLHGEQLPKPPIYTDPTGKPVDLTGAGQGEEGFRTQTREATDEEREAGAEGRTISTRGQEAPLDRRTAGGTGTPGQMPIQKDPMYGIQSPPLFPQDDPGLMQELPQDQLPEEQPVETEPDPDQGELTLPDAPLREGWTDNPDAGAGEPIAFMGSPQAHTGYVIEQPEEDGSTSYEAFDEDGDFINPADNIEDALDLVERAAGIAQIQEEDAEFENMEDVVQGITDIFGADELPEETEETPADEKPKVEPREVMKRDFMPEPGNIDDAFVDFQLSYYDGRTDAEREALAKKYEEEFGEDVWSDQWAKANEDHFIFPDTENTKYDQFYRERIDKEIQDWHTRRDRRSEWWKEGAPEGLLPQSKYKAERRDAIAWAFLRGHPDSAVNVAREGLAMFPAVYEGAGISKEQAKTIWKNIIGERNNRAIDVYREALANPENLKKGGKLKVEAFLKAMRADYQTWAKGWKRRKNETEVEGEVTVPENISQPTQIGDGFYWRNRKNALGFARVFGHNTKPFFQIVYQGRDGWTYRWKETERSKVWNYIGPEKDVDVYSMEDRQQLIEDIKSAKAGDTFLLGEDISLSATEQHLVENTSLKRVWASAKHSWQHGTFLVDGEKKITAWVVEQSGQGMINFTESEGRELAAAGFTVDPSGETPPQEIEDDTARNEEGERGSEDQEREGETPLSEDARDETTDELGQDGTGDAETGVEPQGSDDQDLTESETPETQVEAGEETPPATKAVWITTKEPRSDRAAGKRITLPSGISLSLTIDRSRKPKDRTAIAMVVPAPLRYQDRDFYRTGFIEGTWKNAIKDMSVEELEAWAAAEVEADRTAAEEKGESDPHIPNEFEPLTEFDTKTVVMRTEELRKEAKAFSEEWPAGWTDALEHFHQAIGELIDGKLEAAVMRLTMARHNFAPGKPFLENLEAATDNVIAVVQAEIDKPPAETETPPAETTEEPPEHTRKMEDEGLDLKRYWDKLREEIEASKTDGTKLWDLLNAKTQRAKLFNPKPHPEASPGTQRYLDAVQASLKTFPDILQSIGTTKSGPPALQEILTSYRARYHLSVGEAIAERLDSTAEEHVG